MSVRMGGGVASIDFGPRLRRLREERRISLREIAETTKISVSTLEALERDDISRMPGGIFSRAIVRSYAAEVGADVDATVRDFVARFPVESVIVGTAHAAHAAHDAVGGSGGHRRLAIVVAILLPIVAILVWSFLV
jgi:cytoskeletal protein RodZ